MPGKNPPPPITKTHFFQVFPLTTWPGSTSLNQRVKPELVKFPESKECSSGLTSSVPCCVFEKDYACKCVCIFVCAMDGTRAPERERDSERDEPEVFSNKGPVD